MIDVLQQQQQQQQTSTGTSTEREDFVKGSQGPPHASSIPPANSVPCALVFGTHMYDSSPLIRGYGHSVQAVQKERIDR